MKRPMVPRADITCRSGIITLEAATGAALLLLTFVLLLNIAALVIDRIRAQEQVAVAATQAARINAKPGATWTGVTADGQSVVSAAWGDTYVKVRVEAGGGRAVAERMVPREVP